MRANELRLGNWIEFNQPKKGIYTTVTNSTFEWNIEKVFRPIQLTEEWLLNFGFKDNLNFKNVIFIDSKIAFYNDNNVFTLANHEYNIEIKYVHQLQNLYFALTGEELTLKNEL